MSDSSTLQADLRHPEALGALAPSLEGRRPKQRREHPSAASFEARPTGERLRMTG
jgi:hypothetical protein